VDGNGVPIGFLIESANVSEFKLAEPVLATIKIKGRRGKPKSRPKVMVGDKGYDSKVIRRALKRRGIRPCIPHRWHKNLTEKEDIEDYAKRWHVERTFAWIGNFRHLTLRYERKISSFLAFVTLVIGLICLGILVSG
jgi:transposase